MIAEVNHIGFMLIYWWVGGMVMLFWLACGIHSHITEAKREILKAIEERRAGREGKGDMTNTP